MSSLPLAIRTAVGDDAVAIQCIYSPIVLGAAISFEEVPPTVDEFRDRISKTLVTYPFLVCTSDGAVVGFAYAGPHRSRAAYRWSADVSVYVDRSRQRVGVGRALYSALLTILEIQGFHAAFAGIALPNEGSVGLHEALGFTPLGVYREVGFKNGRWHDVGWWRKSLRDYGIPEEPLPFSMQRARLVTSNLLAS